MARRNNPPALRMWTIQELHAAKDSLRRVQPGEDLHDAEAFPTLDSFTRFQEALEASKAPACRK